MKCSDSPSSRPPRWADCLLERFCAPHLLEEIQGDLHERFQRNAALLGERSARWHYVREVLSFMRPFAWKRKKEPYSSPSYLNTDMLRNYVKIAWRNLAQNRSFSAINILGLALGMACSLLIFLWIQDEYSVDAYHANGPRLYVVMERQMYDGKTEASPGTPALLPDELKRRFPEIAYAAGLSWEEKHTFAVGDKLNKEKGRSVGADWLRMFTVPLLAGSAETALNAPNNLVISRTLAENYFGSPQAAIGRSIRLDNQQDYQVTAVFETIPENSSLKYDYLLSWQDFLRRNEWLKEWGNHVPQTYVQLQTERNGQPANADRLEAKLKTFLYEVSPSLKKGTFDIHLFLQPFQEVYLHSNYKNGYPDGGRIEYVRLFGIVAVFILLIACINFMNLATARSVKRAREVGIRKVVGAARGLLFGQFMGEALLLTAIALVLALGVVWLLLPVFNELTEKNITLHPNQGTFWITILIITMLTGLIAGSYPALFLSSLNPIRVLKNSLQLGAGARLFRQGLVVFQFVLSTLLIIGMIVIYRQMQYIQTKNLGFDRENLIYLHAEGGVADRYAAFRQELLKSSGIQSVTYMDGTPTNGFGSTGNVHWPGKDPNTNIQFQFSTVDYDFTKTLKLNVTGRDFSPAYGLDSLGYLINKTAARRIGYTDPIGKPLTLWGQQGTIIGIVDDYHMASMHVAIEPLIVKLNPKVSGKTIIVRTQPGQSQEALASLETLWRTFNPKIPFTYRFADEEFQKLYRREMTVGSLTGYFAILAIFISCLGLFGLAAFMAEQRTKEIGVRKVLGASVVSIMSLLSGNFLKLVIIAIVIASPIAGYAMNQWLQDFTYKISLEWWMFAGAGGLAVFIALVTVSFHSIRAALMNPVKTLRSE